MCCLRFYILRAPSVARPNVLEGTLDFELRLSRRVCITEVIRISICVFAICVIIVEEREKNINSQ